MGLEGWQGIKSTEVLQEEGWWWICQGQRACTLQSLLGRCSSHLLPQLLLSVCVGQQPFFQFRLRSGWAVLAELPAAQPSPPSCSSSILSIVLRAGSDCASDSVQNYSAVSSGSYSDDM